MGFPGVSYIFSGWTREVLRGVWKPRKSKIRLEVKAVSLSELMYLIKWDLKINRGFSWDAVRAMLLLVEFRIEQYAYRKLVARPHPITRLLWCLIRGFGALFQWFLCNSNIPGQATIGRGLRLPHPQNIIIANQSDIGEFCTIYQGVSIAWNGFKRTKALSPKIGSQVLIGAGAIIIGDITIGSYVLIGAGAVVAQPVPSYSRVTPPSPVIKTRRPTTVAAQPGSHRHLKDPYSIWR
jgi:serine acetyltransferase